MPGRHRVAELTIEQTEITGKVLLAPRESRARGGDGAPAADTRAATATPGAKPEAPTPKMTHTE